MSQLVSGVITATPRAHFPMRVKIHGVPHAIYMIFSIKCPKADFDFARLPPFRLRLSVLQTSRLRRSLYPPT
jgi:hypothetical protein